MYSRKFALAGLAIGVLGITAGAVIAVTGSPGADDGGTVVGSGRLLDASTGIAPIEEVVEYMADRADRRPSDYVARVELARALSTQARQTADLALYERAETAASAALAIAPDHEGAQLELASALHSQHRFSEALAIGERQIAERPGSVGALFVIGDAHFELGDYGQAARVYGRLADLGRNAAMASRLARLAWVEGDSDRAVELAAEAVELSDAESLRPNGKAFYPFQLGHFRFEAGDADGAVDALERALAIDPAHAGATEKLASIEAALGEYESALDRYESLIATGPAPDLHGSAADLLRALGRDAEADEHEALGLELARETMDEFPAERRHLAGFFFDRDPEVALDLARKDVRERRDVGAYDTLAWALHLTGDDEAASEAVAAALARGTRSASFHYHAGVIAAATGDESSAAEHFRTALEINPRFGFGDAADAATRLAALEAS